MLRFGFRCVYPNSKSCDAIGTDVDCWQTAGSICYPVCDSIVAAITFKTEAIPATQATITSQTVKIPASKNMVLQMVKQCKN